MISKIIEYDVYALRTTEIIGTEYKTNGFEKDTRSEITTKFQNKFDIFSWKCNNVNAL